MACHSYALVCITHISRPKYSDAINEKSEMFHTCIYRAVATTTTTTAPTIGWLRFIFYYVPILVSSLHFDSFGVVTLSLYN